MTIEVRCECHAFLAQYDPQHDRLIIKCRQCKEYQEWDLAHEKRKYESGDVITLTIGRKPTLVRWVVSSAE